MTTGNPDDSDDSTERVEVRGKARGSGRGGALARTVLPIILILVVCVGAVVLHVSTNRHLGPLDEQAHLDYINRIQDGHLPEVGQKLSQKTRHQIACRGIETPVGFGDHTNCFAYRTNKLLPEQAYGYEAGQPPIYYVVTAAIAKVMPGDDVDSIKRVGGLWLGVGAIFLYLTLRKLERGAVFSVFLAVALALTPPLLMSATSVSNDIAVWTWGAIGLWAVVGLMKVPVVRWPHPLIGLAIGLAGGLTKPSALLITGAFAVALVLQQWWVGRPKYGFMLGGALVVGALGASGAWGLVVTALQQRPLNSFPPYARYRVSSLAPDQLLKQPLFNLVTTSRAFIPAAWRSDWILGVMLQLEAYAQTGLFIIPLLARWPDDERRIGRSIGLTYLAIIAVSGPYYVVLYYVTTHILYGADSRFAYGLIPMMAVVLAVWVPYRWQRWALVVMFALPASWYLLLLSGAVTPATR